MVPEPRSRPSSILPWLLTVAAASACLLLTTPRPSHADYANINGIRMYYEVRGKGPVLVLLHGGAGNGMQFVRQIPFFERQYRLVIPDMCAQGRSTDRPDPLSYHAMAEDVIALMNHLGIQRFDVMGWSDGGDSGLDMAIHQRDRLKHLVTFGANASPDGVRQPDRAWVDTATVAAFGVEMRAGYAALAPDPSHYDEAMTKLLHMWKTEPQFTAKDLGSIKAKTMICAGENDIVRSDHAEWMAHSIPKAQIWIVPGASHSVMMEKPEEVNAKVLQFLAR